MTQPVQIHGRACVLRSCTCGYQVVHRGAVLATAPTRFLAVARAAAALST